MMTFAVVQICPYCFVSRKSPDDLYDLKLSNMCDNNWCIAYTYFNSSFLNKYR